MTTLRLLGKVELSFDLRFYDLHWDDVKDYYVKNGSLHLELYSGATISQSVVYPEYDSPEVTLQWINHEEAQ